MWDWVPFWEADYDDSWWGFDYWADYWTDYWDETHSYIDEVQIFICANAVLLSAV